MKNLLLVKKMVIKSNKKNPIAKDLFTKKYKLKIVKPKKGKGSFNRKKNKIAKDLFTKKYKLQIVKPKKGKGSFKRKNNKIKA